MGRDSVGDCVGVSVVGMGSFMGEEGMMMILRREWSYGRGIYIYTYGDDDGEL